MQFCTLLCTFGRTSSLLITLVRCENKKSDNFSNQVRRLLYYRGLICLFELVICYNIIYSAGRNYYNSGICEFRLPIYTYVTKSISCENLSASKENLVIYSTLKCTAIVLIRLKGRMKKIDQYIFVQQFSPSCLKDVKKINL